MIISNTVILISSDRRSRLNDELLRCGIPTQICSSIACTMQVLRREKVIGILVDSINAEMDLLELVLNIRDASAEVPIAITGRHETLVSVEPLLREVANVMLISAKTGNREAVAAFNGLLRASSAGSGESLMGKSDPVKAR